MSDTGRRKLKKIVWILLASAAVLAFVSVFGIMPWIQAEKNYLIAKQYEGLQDKEQALVFYEKAGGHKDAPEKAAQMKTKIQKETDYETAVRAVNDWDLDTALENFQSAGDYLDAQEKAVNVEKLISYYDKAAVYEALL